MSSTSEVQGRVEWRREASPVGYPDALEAMEDEPADAALRYLLALQLVRRRVLRIEGDAGDREAAPGTVSFSCRRRDRDYQVAPVEPDELADPAVAARLTGLLWSGEAA